MSQKGDRSGTLRQGRPDPEEQSSLERLKQLLSKTSRGRAVKEDHILSVLLVRQARTAVLGSGLFSDPAWDLMLELYAAHLGERTVCLTDLAAAIGTPLSVTERWVTALVERGLAERASDLKKPE